MYFERRPTGPKFRLQKWPYCPECWAMYQANDFSDFMVDKNNAVMTGYAHAITSSEIGRQAAPGVQGYLLLESADNERPDTGLDREVCEGSQEETEEVNCKAAEPGLVDAKPDS
jgi:hypothetical protein